MAESKWIRSSNRYYWVSHGPRKISDPSFSSQTCQQNQPANRYSWFLCWRRRYSGRSIGFTKPIIRSTDRYYRLPTIPANLASHCLAPKPANRISQLIDSPNFRVGDADIMAGQRVHKSQWILSINRYYWFLAVPSTGEELMCHRLAPQRANRISQRMDNFDF